MESRFGRLKELMRKLMEMQSKTPLAIPITNPNQDLTRFPLAESKRKEIGQEEFDEESFFHQEPPPRALIRAGSRFLNGGTARRKFYGGGGEVVDHYGRHFESREIREDLLGLLLLSAVEAPNPATSSSRLLSAVEAPNPTQQPN
ncbi:hypothetical protein IEQ34_018941 [Dendrobium chrysotoxum]|uniref:Uncharacterized protein n=1 Tax=Dendrobium chrysotoxum TaxID=161865 RepID=A0AAV7G785_DENCH|nr:hypothetical protein IEQ34_018941 [Dendrobium chrysotoxum]